MRILRSFAKGVTCSNFAQQRNNSFCPALVGKPINHLTGRSRINRLRIGSAKASECSLIGRWLRPISGCAARDHAIFYIQIAGILRDMDGETLVKPCWNSL